MKLTITREDLRQFVLREANIDISQAPIDIEIEGYKQMTGRYKWQETTEKLHDTLGFPGEDDPNYARDLPAAWEREATTDVVIGDTVDRKVITDNEGRVLDIVKGPYHPMKGTFPGLTDEQKEMLGNTTKDDINEFEKELGISHEKEPKKAKTRGNRANLKNHPDHTDYENTVLDFATSSEHKRQVPFFGAETIDCVKERYRKIIKKLGVSDSVKFSRINCLPYLVKIEGEKSMNDILNEGVNK